MQSRNFPTGSKPPGLQYYYYFAGFLVLLGYCTWLAEPILLLRGGLVSGSKVKDGLIYEGRQQDEESI